MSKAFLITTIFFAVLTLNALRPLREVSSFFASWLTMELAPHNLVANIILLIVFASTGSIEGTAGTIGLALEAVTVAGLVYMIVQAQRVRGITEQALREGLGADYASQILPHKAAHYDLRVPWRQLLMPFYMRHPDVERVRNISFGPYGRRSLLDVYRHKDHPTGAPVLFFVHGGGWTLSVSDKDRQGKPLMLHFASRGWVCVAANYRLSPRAAWPSHIIDVKSALAWIREHVHEYGGDPNFVFITGGSAGGHLSSIAALTPNDPEYQPGFEDADTSVQAAAPFYGVYDFVGGKSITDWGTRRMWQRMIIKKPFKTHREEFEKANPWHRVNAEAPPWFSIHGAHDSLAPVEGARRFIEKMRATSHNPVVYAELPGGQHAFDVFPSIRSAHVVRAVERFADYVYSQWLAERADLPIEPARRN
ncbi:MAG: alpha/beta hydrolase [Actinomycetota bacterium]